MNSGKRLTIVLATLLALADVPAAHACGHCIEDKIAATYDHAVVTAAKKSGRAVVFVDLRGTVQNTPALKSWIRQQTEATAGVLRGTVRVSLEPAALSFSCDRQAVEPALRTLGQKLARRGLQVSLIDTRPGPTRATARS
jgi:hypothetical protein